LSTQDFSAYLLQAQSSKARIIGLASAGADTVNAIKQAKEYKVDANGQRLAALHAFITDVNSLGLPTTQGLIITSGFYWDATDGTRAWARRFMAEHGRMPTREQAGVYISVRHYLKAVQAAGKADATAVNGAMRKMPVDRFGEPATVRDDGRVIYDIGVYQVKTPAESSGAWDYYRRIASVPGAEAFRPIGAGGCASAQQAGQ
jgi:branched-chain amino acid transport system substrate-binding protein